nr:non-functional pseudokinase ZED1-like isoform X1 [Ziziphus jujuba var. spinosa]XP_048320354.1 non-functional pseudokinase ZED1-like isoform X2 [Ziziphus jujuba var. spinosa]
MFSGFRNHKRKTKEKNFLKNGAAVLEQLIISFNGNCNPIRMYSEENLKKATNNFHHDRVIHRDFNYTLYKGIHQGRYISVKKLKPLLGLNCESLGLITNEVAVASQMSKHKNALKLLGCCIQTELPMLVYEFPANGNLSDHIEKNGWPLPWETKLKIASGIASAVAYLHHGLSKTIIHRDIVYGHVFLDHDNVAKLPEFQTSIPIPAGETHVVAGVFGTHGFAAPEVEKYGWHTEKSDVYGFGILLCEILTGKRYDALRWGSEFSDIYRRNSSNSVVESNDAWGRDLANVCAIHLKTKWNVLSL